MTCGCCCLNHCSFDFANEMMHLNLVVMISCCLDGYFTHTLASETAIYIRKMFRVSWGEYRRV